jgi:hypothetical protein
MTDIVERLWRGPIDTETCDEAAAEIERLRAALREIDQQRYTRRNTINPDNAFEHAVSLNEKLIAVMDIARAALAEEKTDGV